MRLRQRPGQVSQERVRPVGRAHDVEPWSVKGSRCASAEQRYREAGCHVEPAAVAQLAGGEFQPDRDGSLRDEPARALAGATADLKHVAVADFAEQPDVGLVDTLRPPGEPLVAEEVAMLGLVRVGGAVPPAAVGPDVSAFSAGRRATAAVGGYFDRVAPLGHADHCRQRLDRPTIRGRADRLQRQHARWRRRCRTRHTVAADVEALAAAGPARVAPTRELCARKRENRRAATFTLEQDRPVWRSGLPRWPPRAAYCLTVTR